MIPPGIISADGHVCEPANCYVDHIDPKYRDQAPYITDARRRDRRLRRPRHEEAGGARLHRRRRVHADASGWRGPRR